MLEMDMKCWMKFHVVLYSIEWCPDCSDYPDTLLAMRADFMSLGYSSYTLSVKPFRFGYSEDGIPSDTELRVRVRLLALLAPDIIHLVARPERTDYHIGVLGIPFANELRYI